MTAGAGERHFEVRPRPGHEVSDFCSHPDPEWAYECESFTATTRLPGLEWGSVAGWAACSPCNELIERGDRRALIKRCARRYARKHDCPAWVRTEIERDLDHVFKQFFVRKRGPAIPTAEYRDEGKAMRVGALPSARSPITCGGFTSGPR